MSADSDTLMTKAEAAALLGTTIRTLAHWRYLGKLKAHTRVVPVNAKTSEVLYLASDVRAYGLMTGRITLDDLDTDACKLLERRGKIGGTSTVSDPAICAAIDGWMGGDAS